MKITLKAHHFKALFKATADKNDPRQYLHGAYVDVQNNVMVATSGHVVVTVPIKWEGKRADIQPDLIIAKPANTHRISDEQVIIYVSSSEEMVKFEFINKNYQHGPYYNNLIDGKFPCYQHAMLMEYNKQSYHHRFNPLLITPIQKALKSPGIIMTTDNTGGKHGTQKFKIEFMDEPDVKCTLMGMRP